jgi:hypothetical protein
VYKSLTHGWRQDSNVGRDYCSRPQRQGKRSCLLLDASSASWKDQLLASCGDAMIMGNLDKLDGSSADIGSSLSDELEFMHILLNMHTRYGISATVSRRRL